MKKSTFIQVGMIVLLPAIFASCKKDSDSPLTPSEDLKNTVWAGEFRYNTGLYTNLQPFSILLKADHTVEWSDTNDSKFAGTWQAKTDTVTVTFPSGSGFVAIVKADQLTQIKKIPGSQYQVDNLIKWTVPKGESLVGTSWTGTTGTFNFKSTSEVEYVATGGSSSNYSWKVDGAGVRILYSNAGYTLAQYCLLQPTGKQMKCARYITFGATKEFYVFSMTKQ